MNRKRQKLFKVFRRFCALHPFSVKHTLLLCLCLICVEHPGFTGCETGRSLNMLMLIPLSVLARCFFLSLFFPVWCFMAGGWARELLAASVFMYTASRLVDLQRED